MTTLSLVFILTMLVPTPNGLDIHTEKYYSMEACLIMADLTEKIDPDIIVVGCKSSTSPVGYNDRA